MIKNKIKEKERYVGNSDTPLDTVLLKEKHKKQLNFLDYIKRI